MFMSWRRVLVIVFHPRKPTPTTTNVSHNVGEVLRKIDVLIEFLLLPA